MFKNFSRYIGSCWLMFLLKVRKIKRIKLKILNKFYIIVIEILIFIYCVFIVGMFLLYGN